MSDVAHPAAAAAVRSALAGGTAEATLSAFCEALVAAGVPLRRAVVGLDTLHPVLLGRVVRWEGDRGETVVSSYVREGEAEAERSWLNSPFHQLYESGEALVRRRIRLGEGLGEFAVVDELAASGGTDYLAFITRLGDGIVLGEADCVFSSWATGAPEGFDDRHVALIEASLPVLALAVVALGTRNVAETLVETYLGRDAGRRVLRGQIERGRAEAVEAVIWFSDLAGFTRIADRDAGAVIELLNAYAEPLVGAIEAAGGQVLKLIGDGILATFGLDGGAAGNEAGCAAALDAAVDAFDRVSAINSRRAAAGLAATQPYVGLHTGRVFYGNVGSVTRLDFTVVGPAVNEASRIAALCRSLDQPLLASQAFAAGCGPARGRLVSVGRYALRGVARPTELFTLDPEAGQV